MIIQNDIENMPIEKEIKHIINLLNFSIKKMQGKIIYINNTNSFNDIIFMDLYLKYNNEIEADLYYTGEKNEKYNIDKIKYIEDKNDLIELLTKLTTSNEILIINTDTLTKEKINHKINYNITVFKDYTDNYIKKIGSFLNSIYNENTMTEKEEFFDQMLKDYCYNKDIFPSLYEAENLKSFYRNLPKQLPKESNIINSITYNYMKNIVSDSLINFKSTEIF